jgi:abortive infection bacteriophage resistance protein
MLFFAPIQKVEQNIKALIAYHFSDKYGHDHNTYLNAVNFDSTSKKNVSLAGQLINKIKNDINNYAKRQHRSIVHYLSVYNYIPLWVLVNILTFGRINVFYSRMKLADQQIISANFGLSAAALNGFLYFLASFRNRCAHGERIYTAKNTNGNTKKIPDTPLHVSLQIPNKQGNYIKGKDDVLALLISLKLLIDKKDFLIILKEYQKELADLAKKIPSKIMVKNLSEIGTYGRELGKLK